MVRTIRHNNTPTPNTYTTSTNTTNTTSVTPPPITHTVIPNIISQTIRYNTPITHNVIPTMMSRSIHYDTLNGIERIPSFDNNDFQSINIDHIFDEPEQIIEHDSISSEFYDSDDNFSILSQDSNHHKLLQNTSNDPIHDYIGLNLLNHIIYKQADTIEKNNPAEAISLYNTALLIDPYLNTVNIAIIYEQRFNDFHKAIYYYNRAIHYLNDELAMYNLADLYYKQKDFTNAFKFFEMAFENGDIQSSYYLIIYYYQQNYINLFAKHLLNFLTDDKRACNRHQSFCSCHIKNIHFKKFFTDNNVLMVYNKLNDFHKPHSTFVHNLINHLNSNKFVSIYNNKISLFQKLNHIQTCDICYEDNRLNIDNHCGHSMCTSCYTRVFDKPCPFCRTEPLV